ncbi:MAG: FlgD immunoglobulin-like domain containing protein [Fibrobacterota bacterium]
METMLNIKKVAGILTLLGGLASIFADTTYVASKGAAILSQFNKLRAGDTLLILPGTYNYISPMVTFYEGTPAQRIVVRAASPNTVFIKHYNEELFVVTKRYYTVENLNMNGMGYANYHFKCNDGGQNLHIRNCVLTQFGESTIKAGSGSTTPDSIFPGSYLIMEGNEISSDTLGITGNGNGFNIDGSEDCVIRNNWVHGMQKPQGNSDFIVYSGYFKGGSRNIIIEGNIFDGTGINGYFVGFSFGGGCMGNQFMRSWRPYEDSNVCYRNNVLIACNDVQHTCPVHPSYVRKVYHNTLIFCTGELNVDDVRNNLVLGGSVTNIAGTHNFTGTYNSAYFWDVSQRNYALKPAATAWIGKAPRIDSAATDGLGTLRPAMCAYGAYEPYNSNPASMEGGPGVLPEVLLLDIGPNPANAAATIHFTLACDMKYVEIGVYDLMGRTVRLLYDGPQQAGTHAITWDGKGHTDAAIGSGVYLVRLRVGDRQAVKSFTFVR